ncbi:MAG: hypothetical protein ABIP51_01110 [Bacteroidia bacterium]
METNNINPDVLLNEEVMIDSIFNKIKTNIQYSIDYGKDESLNDYQKTMIAFKTSDFITNLAKELSPKGAQ